MNLLDEFNPMLREARLYEKRARFAQTLAKLTTGKGRKYVSLPNLKKELDADDAEFDILMSDAKKANRYSNKYIFTEVDGEPCIGITASKRKRRGKAMEDPDARTVEPSDVGVTGTKPEDAKEPEVKTDDVGVSGKKKLKESVDPTVEANLWRAYKAYGWQGLMKSGPLPEGWELMAATEVIEAMARV